MDWDDTQRGALLHAFAFDSHHEDYWHRQCRAFVAELSLLKIDRLAEKAAYKLPLSLDEEAIDAILDDVTHGLVTDRPAALAECLMAWIVWLVERGVVVPLSDSPKVWLGKAGRDRRAQRVERLVARLEDFRYETKSLARWLLEEGWPPEQLNSAEARQTLSIRPGYDEDYVDEFLWPAPPVAWAGVFAHPWSYALPMSQFLYPGK